MVEGGQAHANEDTAFYIQLRRVACRSKKAVAALRLGPRGSGYSGPPTQAVALVTATPIVPPSGDATSRHRRPPRRALADQGRFVIETRLIPPASLSKPANAGS
jgi:hypothetical protein